ncbi:MAG: sugar phosphate isomerase/epimerase [Propionicimonas sp.]|nr:sugar phosphate isomerase/epimerase [Propionicimonas sp.]
MSLTFGIAPDSWGVWDPKSPENPPWERFLDDIQRGGFVYVELGPYGYLPTDRSRLSEELERRSLQMLAGTQISVLHSRRTRQAALADARQIAELIAPLGAKFMVGLDGHAIGRDDPRKLDPIQWRDFVETSNQIGKLLAEEFDMTFTFHPHADGLVEYREETFRYLDDTDPRFVSLCLDTGHYEYRDGDSVELFRKYTDRIPFLHIKSVNPEVLVRVEQDDLSMAEAVPLGVIAEPEHGKVNFPALRDAMVDLGYDGWAVIEHDIHPLPNFDVPLQIATRSKAYYESLGWSVTR